MRLPQNPPARAKLTWSRLLFLRLFFLVSLFGFGVALLPMPGPAADLGAVLSGASNDLQKAVAELTTVRTEIESFSFSRRTRWGRVSLLTSAAT
jgi:hypothetical protein